MKKTNQRWMMVLVLSLVFVVVLVCTKYFSHIQKETVLTDQGPIIPIVSALAEFDEGYDSSHIINNSGMSGTNGRSNSHSNEAESLWQVTADANENVSIVFDLGHTQPLGEMWVWNYNGKNAETDKSLSSRGLKNVRLFYSVDSKNWSEWKGEGYPFRFAQGDGGDQLLATNLEGDHSPIVFNGIPARYVKVTAEGKPGEGNWAEKNGEPVFGLSEVRIYRYDVQVVEGGQIVPISVKSDGVVEELAGAENTINHFGLYREGSVHVTHDTSEEAMWLATAKKGKQVSLIFDLGGSYPLQSMKIWNYNSPGNEDRGVKGVEVYYSIDGKNWTELKSEGYPYELAKATGTTELKATNLNDGENSPILFNGVRAKFIKLVPVNGWGTDIHYGLSEVQFTAATGVAIEPVYEWDALFSRYDGWSGSDGIFSLPLNGHDAPGRAKDQKSLFLFSDTFIGQVHPVTRQRLQASMLNNSVAVLEGDTPNPSNMKWIWTANTADVNIFTPKTPNSTKDSWFWHQDGVVIGDKVFLFPLNMKKDLAGEAGFQFAISGVSMVSVPISEETGEPFIEKQEQFDTPLFEKLSDGSGNIVFGAGILHNTEASGATNPDGYIYVYGYKDLKSGTKELIVSRVKPEEINQFDSWEYWNGTEWASEILEVATLVTGVSPELSVTYMEEGPYKGKFLLVIEKDTLSGYIAVSYADSPSGPFSPVESLYYVPEMDIGNGVITYNAKAHPHLSKTGELLVTYNVNTTNPLGNNINGDIYRPRWLKMREIKSDDEGE